MSLLQRRVLTAIISLCVLVAAWEALARFNVVPATLFTPPSGVMRALGDLAATGELQRDLKASLWRAAVGLAAGCVAGVAVGSLTGRSHRAADILAPAIQLLRPLPPVAIIPLVIVWWGIGETSKVFSISFAVFFPMWISAHIGVRSVPPLYLWSAKSLGVSGLALWWRVILPAALPIIIAGLRTAVALSFVMVFVSELAGASSGLGYQISVSHLAYRVDKMMAALLVLGLCGAAADLIITQALERMLPWLRQPTLR